MSGLNLRERAEAADKELVDFKATLDDNSPADDIARLSQMAVASMEAWNAFNVDQQAEYARNGAKGKPLGPGGLPLNSGEPVDLAGQSGIVDPNGMTVAQAFVKSPAYAEVLNGGSKRASLAFGASMSLATQNRFDFREDAQNALIWTGDPDTLGLSGYDRPTRLPGIVDTVPYQSSSIRQLCTNLTTTDTSVEWVRLASKSYGAAVVPEAQSEDVIDGTTVTDEIGGLKPRMDFALSIESTTTKTIAVLSFITIRQALSPSEMLGLLRQLMLEDIQQKEDFEILNGTGGATSLDGILSAKWGIATSAATGTSINKVLGTIGEIVGSGFSPNAIVMNPTTWHSDAFMLSVNGNSDYILADPKASMDQLNRLWGMQVVTNPGVAAGTILVGDFRRIRIWDRMQSRVEMTDSNRDLFERNILTLRAEEELALGIVAPEAFRKIV